ncbi:AMP-binding protein [Treponema sp.]|uniref:AMP-binding protein n=1 Tax=Treponema sp. TaxID=166 RepID=UPI00298DB3DA|nr:AMP-binding protein [Treponema sp.]MCR5614395.1 AMP-binding protein [Treponema sp.]
MNFINELLKLNCERFPERKAYIYDEEFITFKELYEKSLHYGKILQQLGNSPVVIRCDKSLESYLEIFSCIVSGRAYVPIDISVPEERVEKIKVKCVSDLVLIPESLRDLSEDFYENAVELVVENQEFDENKIVYIISTSGSTGEPKEVPVSYKNLFNFCNWINSVQYLSDYKDETVLNNSSFSFDLTVFSIYYSLLKGHTLRSIDLRFDTLNEFNDLKISDTSIICATPSFIKFLLLYQSFDSTFCKNLKFIFFCGENLEPAVVKKIFKRFPDVKIYNAYGPSEATCAVCGSFINQEMCEQNLLPMGDVDSAAAKIEISEKEIVLKGDSVFRGYLGEKSPDVYFEDGVNCFRTGDFAFVKQNKLYFEGRCDFMVKYSGYRIDLYDIEFNLKTIEGVKDAVVTAKHDKNGNVIFISAFCVSDLSVQKIKSELAKKIPDYMIPKKINLLQTMPVNKNGKIDRQYLETL